MRSISAIAIQQGALVGIGAIKSNNKQSKQETQVQVETQIIVGRPRKSTESRSKLKLLLLLHLSISAVASQQQQQQQRPQPMAPDAVPQWPQDAEFEPNYALGNGNNVATMLEQASKPANVNNRLPWLDADNVRRFVEGEEESASARYDLSVGRLLRFARQPAYSTQSASISSPTDPEGKQRDDSSLSLSSNSSLEAQPLSMSTKTTATTQPPTMNNSSQLELVAGRSLPVPEQQQQSAGNNLDSRLANFIKSHLEAPEKLSEKSSSSSAAESSQQLQSFIANDLGKIFRILRFAGKVADKLGAPTKRQFSSSDTEKNSRSGSNEERETLALGSAAKSGFAEAVKRHSSKLLIGRLVKKTDWNTLFVKLAKVFLQYFLDLILNDMFGTTGK